MFAFTKQEQRFVLLLLFAFIVGLGVKLLRNHTTTTDDAWSTEKENIYQEFQSRSQTQAIEASAEIQQHDSRSISKTALIDAININTASSEELQLLPRIGPATAAKIIAARTEHGPFVTIQDIQNVKGIGPKTFETIKEYIKTE